MNECSVIKNDNNLLYKFIINYILEQKIMSVFVSINILGFRSRFEAFCEEKDIEECRKIRDEMNAYFVESIVDVSMPSYLIIQLAEYVKRVNADFDALLKEPPPKEPITRKRKVERIITQEDNGSVSLTFQ